MQRLELTFSLNSQGKLRTRKIPRHLETHWTIHRIHSLPIVFYLPWQTSHPHVHRKKAKTRLSSSDDPDTRWGAQLIERSLTKICASCLSRVALLGMGHQIPRCTFSVRSGFRVLRSQIVDCYRGGFSIKKLSGLRQRRKIEQRGR